LLRMACLECLKTEKRGRELGCAGLEWLMDFCLSEPIVRRGVEIICKGAVDFPGLGCRFLTDCLGRVPGGRWREESLEIRAISGKTRGKRYGIPTKLWKSAFWH